ncbi:MAG: ribosome maturation factor RimP [Pseudomonadota bacterium]
MSADILESVKEIIEPIIIAERMELVHLEYRRERKGWVLRLYIDKDEGVTIDDCSNISGQVSQLMDIDELIPNPYVLEVSSPGLGSPLKKEEDFIRHKDRIVRFKVDVPTCKLKNFKGRLLEYEAGVVKVNVKNKIINLPLNRILEANLVYKF